MSANLSKVQNLIRIVNSFISINADETLTNDILDQYIESVKTMFDKFTFTDEEIQLAKNDLTYYHQIYCPPGESILLDYDERKWYSEKRENGLIDDKFWERYKTYLIDKKNFSPNVVTTLGKDTLERDIMNCLGNPDSEQGFFKRGLIIGDVQSGKTSTYIGMMCKAADAGYRVFILLTGTIESLRKQTQERVEEGFVGFNMSSERDDQKRVGVGLDNKPIFAMSMTSRTGDFVGDSDKIAVSLKSHDAIVFVIKKNSSVLKKLIDWLRSLNVDVVTGKINEPMLLIDDEADNASINTSASKEDPSKINKLIRELAALFSKSNYVAFTATPYANVFIDPITTDDMINHDLFPEDFIYALSTPSNYIGPQQTFSRNGKYYNQLVTIDDAGETEEDGWPFYFKHKKEWEDELPNSLTDAIYSFYIANAIRDLRGQQSKHRSMLINISRFVRVQYYIKSQVEKIHDDAYRAIKFNLNADDFDESMRDPILKRIYNCWVKYYTNVDYIEWKDIAKLLFKSIEDIQIKVVNSTNKKDKLIYSDDSPIRVIAIGGLALSRGLTLEGLMTSYFYRNTATYDVLMQMGRWFGYRKGYEDIFRIWTHEDSARWYAEIAESTEILKQDMRNMHDNEMKPKQFGIRVRNDCSELQITSRIKMRNATDSYEFSSYAGRLCETPYLVSSAKKNRENFEIVKKFVEDSVREGKLFEQKHGSGLHHVLQDVEKTKIVSLLKKLNISKYNCNFDVSQIVDYIMDESNSYIDVWDIAFLDGSKRTGNKEVKICDKIIYKIERNNCSIDKDRIRIGTRGKLSGPSDGLIGIEDYNGKTKFDIIDRAKKSFSEDYYRRNGSTFNSGKEFPSDTWFKFVKDRKPIIMFYLIDICSKQENVGSGISSYRDAMKNDDGFEVPSVGLAIGFPYSDSVQVSHKRKYKANRAYNYFEQDELDEEMEEVE